jgi:hypothetical protein
MTLTLRGRCRAPFLLSVNKRLQKPSQNRSAIKPPLNFVGDSPW